MPLFDAESRIFAVLAGQPSDVTYGDATQKAHEAIMRAGASMRFSPKEKCHRRGNFPAKNVGVSYGMGQGAPDNLNCGIHTEALRGLLEEESIRRMAAFASCKQTILCPRMPSESFSSRICPLGPKGFCLLQNKARCPLRSSPLPRTKF